MCCLVTFALDMLLITCSIVATKLTYVTRREILFGDVTKSCDNHDAIPLRIVNMVVALVDVHGACWLTWLPVVCNHDLPVPLLAFVEQSIFQVW